MNARRAIVILGAVAVLLITALVTVAVLLHRKEEVEKNRAKTAPARARRHEPKPETENVAGDSLPEQDESKGEVNGEIEKLS
jgi:hypothetical protein